jgi:hypothetical protein
MVHIIKGNTTTLWFAPILTSGAVITGDVSLTIGGATHTASESEGRYFVTLSPEQLPTTSGDAVWDYDYTEDGASAHVSDAEPYDLVDAGVASPALTPANCYVTQEEADIYLTTVLDTGAWDSADEGMRARALIAATRIIDSQRYGGRKAADGQAHAFPRAFKVAVETFDHYTLSTISPGAWQAETSVSQAVKDATVEQAVFELEVLASKALSVALKRQAAGVSSVSSGDTSESYKPASSLCPRARDLLFSYLSEAAAIR